MCSIPLPISWMAPLNLKLSVPYIKCCSTTIILTHILLSRKLSRSELLYFKHLLSVCLILSEFVLTVVLSLAFKLVVALSVK
jgi:hypothetical protein